MRPAALVLIALVAPLGLKAHADPMQVFQLSISFAGNVGVGGQITLDTATDQFTSLGAVTSGLPTGGSYFGIASQGIKNGDYTITAETSGPYGLTIVLPETTLAGYDGSAVCTGSLGAGCFAATTLNSPALSGSLTPVAAPAATPEPSSIALLGTGLLGLAGLVRKRAA